MLNKILFLTTTVTLCATESPHQPQLLQKSSNQAVYSQSFNREDVPLSYKYSTVHVYTTPSPKVNNYNEYQNGRQEMEKQTYGVQQQSIYKQVPYTPSLYANNAEEEQQKQPPRQQLYTKITATTSPPANSKDQVEYNGETQEKYNPHQQQYFTAQAASYKHNPNNQYYTYRNGNVNSAYHPYTDYIKAVPILEQSRQTQVGEQNLYKLKEIHGPGLYPEMQIGTIYKLAPGIFLNNNNNMRLIKSKPIFEVQGSHVVGTTKHLNIGRSYVIPMPAYESLPFSQDFEKVNSHTQAFIKSPRSSQIVAASSNKITQLYPMHDTQKEFPH